MFNRLKEAIEQNLSAEDTGEGQFQCPICRKRFADPALLITHHSSHDSDSIPPEPRRRPSSTDQASAKGLQADQSELNSRLSKLTEENEMLRKSLKEKEQQGLELNAETESCRAEAERLSAQLLQMEAKTESLVEENETLKKISDEISDTLTATKDILSKSSAKVTFLENSLTEKSKMSEQIQAERDELCRKLNSIENQLKQDDTELYKIYEANEKSRKDAADLLEIEKICQEQRTEINSMTRDMEELNDDKIELELKVAELDDFRNGLENSNSSFLKHIQTLEDENEKSISEILELKHECEALSNGYQDTAGKLDNAESQMANLSEEFQSSQSQIRNLQTTITELNLSCGNSEKLVSDMMSERQKLETQMKLFEEDVLELTNTNQHLRQDKDMLSNSLEQHIEQVRLSQQEAAQWAESLVTKDEEISQLTKAIQDSEEKNVKKDDHIAVMEAKVSSLQKYLKEAKSLGRQSETQLSKIFAEKETWIKTRETLISQSEKLNGRIVDLKEKLSELKQNELQFKSEQGRAEKSLENSLQKENDTHQKYLLETEKLDRAKIDLAEADHQVESLEKQLETSCAKRERLSSDLQKMEVSFQNFKKDHKEMENAQTAMASEIYHLKEDYDTLKYHDEIKTKELCAARTALTELGGKHAEIQVAWNAEKSIRWESDEQVNQCRSCSAEFSLLVRRHHCRRCGIIFCWQCSDYTIMMPSSDRPQRVCQKCSTAS